MGKLSSRREFLALASVGTVPFVGCFSKNDGGITVSDIVVQKAVIYESVMGSGGVLTSNGEQYVVATVSGNRDTNPSEFVIRAGDQSWQSGLPETRGAVNTRVADHGGGPVGSDVSPNDPSFLAFTLPSPLPVSDAHIEYVPTEQTWSLPASEREILAAPAPRFELQSFDAPDSVTRGNPLSVSVTVQNISEKSGRFLAAIYWPTRTADDDESTILDRRISAGETTTFEVDIDTEETTSTDGSVNLVADGHITATRDITVTSSET
jgi:hypothetical protein